MSLVWHPVIFSCHWLFNFLGIITSSVSSHPTSYLRQKPIPYSTLVTFFFRIHKFFSLSGSPSVTLLIANTVHWVSTKGSAFVPQLISASYLLFLIFECAQCLEILMFYVSKPIFCLEFTCSVSCPIYAIFFKKFFCFIWEAERRKAQQTDRAHICWLTP